MSLIEFLIRELPPIGRHIRAGALMAALILMVGLFSDILADPELYAAVVAIASIISGVVGQSVQVVEQQVDKARMHRARRDE